MCHFIMFDSKGVVRIIFRGLVHWVMCSLEPYFFAHEVSVTFEMSYYIVRLYLYFTLCNLKMAFTIAETCGFFGIFFFNVCCVNRLRWSRSSVLAFGTQVRGFKPDRSRKNLQHAFLRRGSKAVCPMSQIYGM